ncbi:MULTISPECIES: hypothetical protein [Methylosinus]|uniref:Uncharacterized protein n=1 Tax=Methylosinus trichosporium (strain ATCC 35070 / NCIMB 11131 / UNIQEM 75 / OB3b) TaxID=595536 RepID=A0A2D2D3D7_METT3|nr:MULTISPECIES: hypothetical protein [Methylosinus]ATQ69485.1 hypothetical protein CQW49_17560 [Methylosinus trichosporium OB3b]OBS51934.1 hypothetical protein A8B73_13560 [Methylosinus sp. 3S-1]
MHKIKFRMSGDDLKPRRTRMEIPGWAGQPEKRTDGSHEHAWHCVPFSEYAKYGVEIFYPYKNELRVSTQNGRLILDGDFGSPPDPVRSWPPFRDFGASYYTYQLLLDLKPEPGYSIKVETHPSFYTDSTGTAPIAVPAIIREWWPMVYFLVFKSPTEGQTHIFRADTPMAQFTMIPAESDVELEPMSFDEAAERELQSRRIYASRETLGAASRWLSSTDTVFDGTYRHIYGAARSTAEKK